MVTKRITLLTSWGEIRMDVADDGIVGCALPFLSEQPKEPFSVLDARGDAYSQYAKTLLEGGRSQCPAIGVIAGTVFQKQVWKGLRTIPHGTTISYGGMARELGRPTSFRAVANACGRNPVPLFIPCHRVIAADGSLGGFSGGLAWKRLLLDVEQKRCP